MKLKSMAVIATIILAVGCAKDTHQMVANDTLPKVRIDKRKAAEYNVQLGIAYLQAGETTRAKIKLNHALDLAPKLPSAYYAMGLFLEKTGEPEKAQQSYLTAIQLNPNGGREHNNYGAFLCRQHRFDAAEKEFLIAVDDDKLPNTAEVYENAGMCAEEAKSEQKAKQYYEKALMIDGSRLNALLALSEYALQAHDAQKAKDLFVRYTQENGPITERSATLGLNIAKSTKNTHDIAEYERILKSHFSEAKQADEMFVK